METQDFTGMFVCIYNVTYTIITVFHLYPLTHAKRFVLVSVVCFQQQLGSVLRHHSSCKDTYTEMACFNCAWQYVSAIMLGMRMVCVYVIRLISSCGLFFVLFSSNPGFSSVRTMHFFASLCCWSVACILCFLLTLGLSALQILFHIAFWITIDPKGQDFMDSVIARVF